MLIQSSEEEASRIRGYMLEKGFEMLDWNRTGIGWLVKYFTYRPTLVIMDYVLPRIDGLAALAKLREKDNQAVVLMTHPFHGHMANEIETKMLFNGAISVLQKPCQKYRTQLVVDRLVELLE